MLLASKNSHLTGYLKHVKFIKLACQQAGHPLTKTNVELLFLFADNTIDCKCKKLTICWNLPYFLSTLLYAIPVTYIYSDVLLDILKFLIFLTAG